MAVPLIDGTEITFQGKVAEALPFEYSRSTGLEPSFGHLHIARSQFADFTIKESIPGLDSFDGLPDPESAGPSGGTQSKPGVAASTPKTQERTAKGFTSAGDLVISENLDGVEVGRVEIKQ